jgi:hypothetical protein
MKRIVFAALFLLTPPLVFSQAVSPPAFEVASVKVHPFPPGAFGFGAGGGGTFGLAATELPSVKPR